MPAGRHRGARGDDHQLPGHLQVDQQAAGRIEREYQYFAAPAHVADRAAHHGRSQRFGRPGEQRRVQQAHRRDAPAHQRPADPAARHLHFRQFWHVRRRSRA
jgi:hypothetical protein